MSNSTPSPTPPSPPPPPPSPASVTQPTKTPLAELNLGVINNSSNRLAKPNHQNVILSSGECAWATQYPEIQKACFLNRVCQYAPPRELRVQNVEPILQNGPTCGLTALSMIFDGAPSSKALLELAVARGYSNNGEMFSARQLNELFEQVLEENRHLVEYKPVTHTLVGGWMDDPNIQVKLRLGAMFLVPYPFPTSPTLPCLAILCKAPGSSIRVHRALEVKCYDPDRNHTPCLNKGHRAHWALVVGYLIDQFDDFYVFARHGKTKNLALWSLRDLSRSNGNLVEFCQPVGHPNETFILPEGGMGGCNGLRCKFIMIEHYKAKNEIVL
uniref:Actin maturation protease n=1 Tax=Anopheles stephensi TaxID=30069 RepID=A0A182XXQ1_ANOST